MYLPGRNVRCRKIELKNIPPVFHGLYDFSALIIDDQSFLEIKVKDKSLGPKDFKKHSKRIRESIDYSQVWYLHSLHPHKVRRMIENELNFIIENKCVHLPILNTSIKSEPERLRIAGRISGLSMNLIIREILLSDLSGLNKVELAKNFKTSKMTMGRALEPLLMADLCEENKVGIAKFIEFKPRNLLWKYLRKKGRSPVKEVV